MRKPFLNIGKVSGALLLAAAALYAAEGMIRYVAQPESKLRIDGTSTLHDWTVDGPIIGGYLEADPKFERDPSIVSKVKPTVEVTIPVSSLKSDKKPMDNVMREAMKQKDHKTIKYRLREMKLKGPPSTPNGPYLFDTSGELTVSGVTRTNDMLVVMEKLEGNKLKFSGTNSMKMTDFGIKPPSPAMALGLIKTGDDVKVSFEWVTAPSTADGK